MKPNYLILLLFSLLFTTGDLFSQKSDPRARQPLIYVQSSTGMASPEWEGGRSELEFADMNQDGFVDIISIGDHGSPYINTGIHGIMVYFGDGQGNWSLQMTGNFGYGGIAAGDVNNDGFMDVGYGMHHNYSGEDLGDQLIEVALGDGSGVNWIPWDDGLATSGETYGMFGTDFADVDNDGDLDLGSISFGCCNGVRVYLNNMDGTWSPAYSMTGGNSDMIFEFGDINNDGFMDFIAGYEYGTAFFGDGTGGFTLNDQGLPPAGSIGRNGPSLGDINNNGFLDLAFTSYAGGVFVYAWNDDDQQWEDWSGNLPSSGTYEMTQLADMNMDGFIDLAVFGRGTFQLYLGDGNGNWMPDATFTSGSPGYAKAFRVGGDIDHNGFPDIVFLEQVGTWISYKNHLRCYRESSVPQNLSIKPVFPRGHERLWQGSIRFIDWITAVPGTATSQVKLEYSISGPEGPWSLIADILPDNGRYQWLVPPVISNNCYIRYTVTSGESSHTSITPAAFTITDGTVGMKENANKHFDLQVYPNPAGSKILVGFQRPVLKTKSEGSAVGGQDLPVSLCIFDMLGRKLKSFSAVQHFPFEIDVSDLRQGFYQLRVQFENGRSSSVKFLKMGE